MRIGTTPEEGEAMRRAWAVALAVLIGPGAAVDGPAQQGKKASSPYAGTWKVSVIEEDRESAVWILRLDPAAKKKKVEVLWGLVSRQADFTTSEPELLKADATGLRINMRTGGRDYLVNALPPFTPPKPKEEKKGAKPEPERMRGSVAIGHMIGPVRLERTEEKALARDRGLARLEGAVELEAASTLSPLSARYSAMRGLVKTYSGQPLALIASQVAVTHLVNNAAAPADFKPFLAPFVTEAGRYGREMRLGAHLALTRTLLGGAKTRELALEQAREAVKALKEKEDPPAVQLYAYVLLVSAQQLLKKETDVKVYLPKVKDLVAARHKAAGKEGAAVAHEMARMLLSSPAPAVAELGLEQARKSVELVGDKAPAWQRLVAQRLLQAALYSRGKKAEAEKVAAVADKLEEELDREYLKDHVPFKTTAYAGRKGKSGRTVLVEMFTNADVLVSAATDVAFDALRKTYKAADVVLVQYHNPSPAPDPLAVRAVGQRVTFYGVVHAGNVPSLVIDGKSTEALGGHRTQAKNRYDTLRGRIDKALEAAEGAKVNLTATRKGEQVEVKAEVSELAKPGERARLHLLLVEGVIRYEGGNGQRLHHDVVRATITPAEGVKLEKKAVSHTAKVDLAAVRKEVLAYLTEQAKKELYPPDRPVELKTLKVVAVVQDSSDHQVFQCAAAEVKSR